MKIKLLYLVLLLVCSCVSRAQDAASTTEQLIAGIFEQYTAESEEQPDYDSFYDDLMFCAQHPVDLNRTTREELEKLQFLSDIQVENILAYVYQYGPMKTIYELQLVDGLDMTDIRRMLPFVRLGEGEDPGSRIYWHDIPKYGRNELWLRFDKGFETKKGYVAEEGGDYLGSGWYHSLKYRFRFKNRIQAGFAAEKDAGEQFWGEQHKGYDFYSAHVQLTDFGKFKTIVAGDYRANFGLGLVLHPDFLMGKSAYVLNVIPRNSGLKRFSSTDETNFFRGAGATFRFKKFDLTAFYSNKNIDGDTVGGSFPSLIKTGYHRTSGELSDKHTVNQQVVGGNATYTYMNMQLGVTMVHTLIDQTLMPDKSVYNRFYFEGKSQTTGGVSYRCCWKKLNLFGETAVTTGGGMATLNGCTYSPTSLVSLVVLQRYFAPEYDTFFASSFSESSRVGNENGIYLGAEVRPMRNWKFSAYADSYRFPWPKYGIDAPTPGSDYLLQADFVPKSNVSMFWRLKYKDKQENFSGSNLPMPVLEHLKRASMRYQLLCSYGIFRFKNVIEGNWVQKGGAVATFGVIALQNVGYTCSRLPLKVDFGYLFFDATDYENRLYCYENDLPYAFSIPMFLGQGSRCYLNMKYEVNRKFSLWFKIGQTIYADGRESVSSGNETIAGNRKTDARLMVNWEF